MERSVFLSILLFLSQPNPLCCRDVFDFPQKPYGEGLELAAQYLADLPNAKQRLSSPMMRADVSPISTPVILPVSNLIMWMQVTKKIW